MAGGVAVESAAGSSMLTSWGWPLCIWMPLIAGALMVSDSKVVGVEPDRIVFDRLAGYRTKAGQTWGPPAWEFAARVSRST